jgi:hypothetical protein
MASMVMMLWLLVSTRNLKAEVAADLSRSGSPRDGV